jgi:hypothetical protein
VFELEKIGVRGNFEPAEKRIGLESRNLACLPAIVSCSYDCRCTYTKHMELLDLIVQTDLNRIGKTKRTTRLNAAISLEAYTHS